MKHAFVWIGILILSSCGTLRFQQPLPNSLWGEWALDRTGLVNEKSSETQRYLNRCSRYDDILHFSSDKKMTFRWRDEGCGLHYYKIGRYSVDKGSDILHIQLHQPEETRNRPFPDITQFRIEAINETTLHLREIKEERSSKTRRGGVRSDAELRLVFRRIEN